MSRERLPRLYDVGEPVTFYLLDHHMDMVGHDDPRQEQIPVTVKTFERITDDGSVSRLCKQTFAGAFIDSSFQREEKLRAIRRDGGGFLIEFPR
jgi:hypothetical protein